MASALDTLILISSRIEIEPSEDVTALLTCSQLRIIEFEMFILRFILLISLLLALPCYAEEKTILVLGDSLSAAYGIEVEQGWVSLLQSRLNQNYNEGLFWNVVNASVSGDTTTGGLARLPNLLALHQPAICIIELGANDGLRGQSITQMRNQLNTIVTLCEKIATTLLLGIKLPPNYGKKYSNEFHHTYLLISKDNSIALVPFILKGIAFNETLMQTDGLHPNAKAQPIILNNIWPSLNKLLKKF